MRIVSGSVTEYIYFVAVDATDLKTRETGLSGFTVYRSRNNGAATVYTTPTVAEVSAANMPGVYALLVDEDTTIGAGNDSEEYCVHITQASMAPVTRSIELYRAKATKGGTLTVSGGVATDTADAILDEVCEAQGSYTLRQAISILLAVLAGVTSDNGATLKTPNGVATRVAATIDANNNRTAVTLTP